MEGGKGTKKGWENKQNITEKKISYKYCICRDFSAFFLKRFILSDTPTLLMALWRAADHKSFSPMLFFVANA